MQHFAQRIARPLVAAFTLPIKPPPSVNAQRSKMRVTFALATTAHALIALACQMAHHNSMYAAFATAMAQRVSIARTL
jgi:hypothetical protein